MPSSFGPNINQSGQARHSIARVPAFLSLIAMIAALLVAVGACVEETDQRAVQPGEVAGNGSPSSGISVLTATRTIQRESAATPSSDVQATSTTASSAVQPMPSRIYYTHGGDLWQIPVASGTPSPVLTGHNILAFAPAPNGEQVAVIYLANDANKEHLADFKADGTSVVDVALAIPADDRVDRGGDVQSAAWSPDGSSVAIARQDGSIAVITNDGTIKGIVAPDPKRFPGALSISPDGKTLLFLDPDLPGKPTSLYTVPLTGGVIRQLIDGNPPANPILSAIWLPKGNHIAYVQAVTSSPNGTGDVFSIDARTAKSQLTMASAQFAPVAGASSVAFSGDGMWAAFTIYVPAESGTRFHGLWLLNLKNGVSRQIDTDADQAVTDLWWGKGGLVFRTVRVEDSSTPQRYIGVEPYWLYSLDPGSGNVVLRHRSP